MRYRKLLLILLCALLFTKGVYSVPTGFIEISVDKSLDKFFVRTLISGPESEEDNCTTKENNQVTCSKFLYFKSPVWANIEPYNANLNTQRFYILTHPDTKAKYISHCGNLATAFSFSTTVSLLKEGEIVTVQPEKIDNLTLSFSLFDNYSAPCIYIEYPYLNPFLIQKNEKFYPFDSYTLDVGYYIPNISLINFEILLPEEFRLAKIKTSPKTQTVTNSKSHIIFFEFKDLETDKKNAVGAKITFERFPQTTDKIFPLVALLILPFLMMLYLLFSPNIHADGRRMNIITSLYIIILPLFFGFFAYFSEIPNVYSLAHSSIILTLCLIGLSFLKDFTNIEFINEKKWKIILVIISLFALIIPLFFK